MNSEFNKDHQLYWFISDRASPYLSPFRGPKSEEDSQSADRIGDAQREPCSPINILAIDSQDVNDEGYQPKVEINEEAGMKPTVTRVRNFKKEEEKGIQGIINFLVENDEIGEIRLLELGRPLFEECRDKQFIFQVLMTKFLKLRKTKEQMTKYCLRKAFKFIGEMSLREKRKNSRASKSQAGYSNEMPFKKYSQEKTMNSQFLRRIFSQIEFVKGYRLFLKQFQRMMEEDNHSKIEFLAVMITRLSDSKQLDKIQNIKRLPWSRSILSRTRALAQRLLDYCEPDPFGES